MRALPLLGLMKVCVLPDPVVEDLGGTCKSARDCEAGLMCELTVPGGYCTATCTTPGAADTCPDESICDVIAGTTISCLKVCESALDCRSDQDCTPVTNSKLTACKPRS
jgi:hypothetical protein